MDFAKSINYPNDTKSQVTGRRAAKFVEYTLSEHIVFASFPQDTDFGIDYFATVKDGSRLSGPSFLCQVKGTSRAYLESYPVVYFSRSTLNYYRSITGLPIILLFVDLERGAVYWEPVHLFNLTNYASGKFKLRITGKRVLFLNDRPILSSLIDYLACFAKNPVFDGITTGPYNSLSEYYINSITNHSRKSEFSAINKNVLEQLNWHFDNPSEKNLQKIINYSNEVVLKSVEMQCASLERLVNSNKRQFICVDRELSFRGPIAWMSNNWVSKFSSLCQALHKKTSRNKKIEMVRFFVISDDDDVALYGLDRSALLDVLNATFKYGFINIFCKREAFANTDINMELTDLWMIPYEVLVLNTPPLYTAEYFSNNCEDKYILDYYSSFFVQALDEARKCCNRNYLYIDKIMSEEEFRTVLDCSGFQMLDEVKINVIHDYRLF